MRFLILLGLVIGLGLGKFFPGRLDRLGEPCERPTSLFDLAGDHPFSAFGLPSYPWEMDRLDFQGNLGEKFWDCRVHDRRFVG